LLSGRNNLPAGLMLQPGREAKVVRAPEPGIPRWWPSRMLVLLGFYFGTRGAGRYSHEAA
jgi:hypothetical protein